MTILEGDLSTVSVEEILEIFFVSAKPATLYLYSEEKEAVVCCAEGGVVWAQIRGFGEAFGGLLLKAGLINEDILAEALREQQTTSSGKRLGEILVDMGIINPGHVYNVLLTQVSNAAYWLISWKNGSFRVEEGIPPIQVYLDPPLDGTTLLIESARRQDEISRFRSVFPSLDVVPVLTSLEKQVELTMHADEWRLLTLINGRRSLREILVLSHLPNFDATEVLYSLYKMKMFTLKERIVKGKETIVIFDSDEDSCSLIERILLNKGFSVSYVCSLQDAEYLILKENVNAVIINPLSISDLKSAFNQFRNRIKPKHVNIVIIADRSNITERLRARLSGADVYLTKPITLSEDIPKITSLLGKAR